jgi:Fe2+ or Zn2+ uptake regulation protein
MTRRPILNARQDAVLAVLVAADQPLSTTCIRERVNAQAAIVLIAEQIYRTLLTLQQHGLVERTQSAPRTGTAYWQIAPLRAEGKDHGHHLLQRH